MFKNQTRHTHTHTRRINTRLGDDSLASVQIKLQRTERPPQETNIIRWGSPLRLDRRTCVSNVLDIPLHLSTDDLLSFCAWSSHHDRYNGLSLPLARSMRVCMFNFARVLRTSNWSCSVIHVQICNQYRSRPVVSLELFLYQYASFTDQWHPITPIWIVNSNDLLLFCDDRRRVVHMSKILSVSDVDCFERYVCVCLRSVNDHRRISLNTRVGLVPSIFSFSLIDESSYSVRCRQDPFKSGNDCCHCFQWTRRERATVDEAFSLFSHPSGENKKTFEILITEHREMGKASSARRERERLAWFVHRKESNAHQLELHRCR